jgi:hypothetical protein
MGTLVQFRKSLQKTIREMQHQHQDVELSREIDDLIDLAVTSWLQEMDRDQNKKEGAII